MASQSPPETTTPAPAAKVPSFVRIAIATRIADLTHDIDLYSTEPILSATVARQRKDRDELQAWLDEQYKVD